MFRDKLDEFIIYDELLVEQDGTTYLLVKEPGPLVEKPAVFGDQTGFSGQPHSESSALLSPLTPENAAVLRQRLPWLRPLPLGLETSFGYGDRLWA